jgi:hypothetical protein
MGRQVSGAGRGCSNAYSGLHAGDLNFLWVVRSPALERDCCLSPIIAYSIRFSTSAIVYISVTSIMRSSVVIQVVAEYSIAGDILKQWSNC